MNIISLNLQAMLNRASREARGEPEPQYHGPPRSPVAYKTVVLPATEPTKEDEEGR